MKIINNILFRLFEEAWIYPSFHIIFMELSANNLRYRIIISCNIGNKSIPLKYHEHFLKKIYFGPLISWKYPTFINIYHYELSFRMKNGEYSFVLGEIPTTRIVKWEYKIVTIIDDFSMWQFMFHYMFDWKFRYQWKCFYITTANIS